MKEDECSNWFVGGSAAALSGIHVVQGPGLFTGHPETSQWQRIGQNQATTFRLLRDEKRVIMSANHGLYAWQRGGECWQQLHDETLTEILAIAFIAGDPGVVAGCPYGVATAQRDELGAARWTFYSDALSPDERFTNALLVDPNDENRWLAGSEAGLLVYSDHGTRNERSDLFDVPVRALYHARGLFWAGTDSGGIFSSENGLEWKKVGGDIEGAVYDINTAGEHFVAATSCGLVKGDGQGAWQRLGPRMLFACVAVDGKDPQQWLAGATPGGLWHTEDSGQNWRQLSHFKHVRAILSPEENA
ncbi:MAG: hypothetical protein ACKVJG_06245 [Candidatus Latescibacterota bacterium]|jgi:photosystem II stability/assembly factor-like uncharacterized protein